MIPAAVHPLPLGASVAIAAVTGLVIGSFLNVVVYRTPRGLSVNRPPSFCPACGTPVRPRDNVPVLSWLVLRGRCRSCRAPISIRYPLVETGTAFVFAAVAAVCGSHWALPGLCIVTATAGALAVVELDGFEPPASVAVVGTALGIAALVAGGAADQAWSHVDGLAIGLGGAVVLIGILDRGLPRTSAAGRGAPLVGSRWALLPAGVGIGWCAGSTSAAAITAVGIVLVGVLGTAAVAHAPGRRAMGAASVCFVAIVAGLCTAAATGGVPGR